MFGLLCCQGIAEDLQIKQACAFGQEACWLLSQSREQGKAELLGQDTEAVLQQRSSRAVAQAVAGDAIAAVALAVQ